jgi:hypothetical protein
MACGVKRGALDDAPVTFQHAALRHILGILTPLCFLFFQGDTILYGPWENRALGKLLPVQCQRLAKRATVDLPRVSGHGHNGSGDLCLAFATGHDLPAESRAPYTVRMIPHEPWIAGDNNAHRKTTNSLYGERPWQPAKKPSSVHLKTVYLRSQRCRAVGKCSIFRAFVPMPHPRLPIR